MSAPADSHSAHTSAARPVSGQLDRIAATAVRLGALGPRLAQVAEDVATQARDQARRAQAIARNMEQLTADLEDATRQLRRSSGDVDAALATVARLALQTRMLAINASIEASRAGEHGRPFGVVVEEVQRLADHSSATTSEIEQRMEEMRASISRVASRPWYRAALASDAVCSTDLYRSSATGDFCFTISVALRDPEGLIRAVLAADVNCQELLT